MAGELDLVLGTRREFSSVAAKPVLSEAAALRGPLLLRFRRKTPTLPGSTTEAGTF